MGHGDLKSTASQVSNQFSANLGTFTSQAAPLQTDVIGKIIPVGRLNWLGIHQIRPPKDIEENQENMADAYKKMQEDGLDSETIGKNLASGMYRGGDTWSPSLYRQQRREAEGHVDGDGSNEGHSDSNRGITGTGNAFVDSYNAFSNISDADRWEKDGSTPWASSKQGLATSGALNAAAGAVGGLADAGVSFDIGRGNYNDRPEAQQLNETQESVRQGIYKGVSMIPGWGPLISAGLQLTDGLGKMLGVQMSNISKDAAEDAGLSRGFNNVVATIPGLGSVLGAFTKKADEFEVDREKLAGVGSAYDMSTFDSAEDLSGGLFLGQRDKVNDFIAEQNRLRDTMTSISDTQKLRKEGASAAAADLAQQNKNRYSGLTGGQMAIGKKGMKLDLSWARGLLSKFQKGGKLGTPGIESNVIVEGAYHAHKNHLDEVNPELSDMTPKGIPVATEDASGNKTQVAEIEVGELILTKDLTDKLEELYKDGSDEAAIQAGMLFANEIIDNTVDNKGGVLDGE